MMTIDALGNCEVQKYATYRAVFPANSEYLQGVTWLDLGDIPSGVARVRLNGRDLGVVWCAPWRVEVTGLLQPSGLKGPVRLVFGQLTDVPLRKAYETGDMI